MRLLSSISLLVLLTSSVYAQRPKLPKCPPYDETVRENGASGADIRLPSEAKPCDDGVRRTKPRRAAPTEIKIELADQNFKRDTDLEKWLNEKGQHLLSIIPFGGERSVFVFESVRTRSRSHYTVNLVQDEYDQIDGELQKRIKLKAGNTFIGIHRLNPSSYLAVFYGK